MLCIKGQRKARQSTDNYSRVIEAKNKQQQKKSSGNEKIVTIRTKNRKLNKQSWQKLGVRLGKCVTETVKVRMSIEVTHTKIQKERQNKESIKTLRDSVK